MPDDPSLSIDEAAARLGVTTRTLRRWVTSGRLRYTRTELGHFRFTVADLNEASEAAS